MLTQVPLAEVDKALAAQAETPAPETPQAPETPDAETPETPQKPEQPVPAEVVNTETPTPEAPVDTPAPAEEPAPITYPEIEAKLFQETEGKFKDVDGLLADYKAVKEQLAQKPAINYNILKDVDAKLKEEKGFGLQEAMYFQNLQIDQLEDGKKVAMTFRAENAERSKAWIDHELSKISIATFSDEEATEKIEDGEFSQREYDEAKVAYADILHRAPKVLEKFKERYEINVNFDAQQAPAQQGSSPEQLAKEKAAFASALKGLDKETFEFALPMNLGTETVSVSIDDQDKLSIISAFDSLGELPKEYQSESGKDFVKFAKDMNRAKNFEKVLKRAVENASALAIKAYEKSRDNVQTGNKPNQPAPPSDGKQNFLSSIDSQLTPKFKR